MSKRGAEAPRRISRQVPFDFSGRRALTPMSRRGNPEPQLLPMPAAEQPKFERFLGLKIVRQYFDTHHSSIKFNWDELDEHAYNPALWHMEEVLVKDLEQAKHAADPKTVEELRKMIYAVSWRSHDRPDLVDLIARIQDAGFTTTLETNVLAHINVGFEGVKSEQKAWKTHVKPSGVFAGAAEKLEESTQHDLEVVERAVEGSLVGDEVNEALTIIESYLDSEWQGILKEKGTRTWKDLERTVFAKKLRLTCPTRPEGMLETHIRIAETLREIRDFFIFNKYYKEWARRRQS